MGGEDEEDTMIILSFNIRAGDSLSKKRRLNHIIRKGKANIVFLQETKILVMNDTIAMSLWGVKEIEWTTLGSNGKSGGIIIRWRKKFLSLLFSFSRTCFMGLAAIINNIEHMFINIYSL